MLNNFSFNDAYRIINNVIDERIRSLTRSGAGIDVTWGTVASIDTEATCSVYLFGENIPSAGFRMENGIQPNLLDPVRVSIDRRGNRWIDAVLADSTLTAQKIGIDARTGKISFGPGTGAFDVNLYRSATDTLKTDDSLDVAGGLGLTGALTVGADWSLSRTGTGIAALGTGDILNQQVIGRGIYKDTTISIPTGGTWTKITAYTNTSQIIGLYSSFNATRHTIEITAAGIYMVQVGALVTGAAAGRRFLGINIANNADPGTGVTPPANTTVSYHSSAATNMYINGTFIVPLVVNDNISLNAFQDSGGALNYDELSLNIFRLGTL